MPIEIAANDEAIVITITGTPVEMPAEIEKARLMAFSLIDSFNSQTGSRARKGETSSIGGTPFRTGTQPRYTAKPNRPINRPVDYFPDVPEDMDGIPYVTNEPRTTREPTREPNRPTLTLILTLLVCGAIGFAWAPHFRTITTIAPQEQR